MLLAANGPWNNSKGHLLFAGANVPNTCQGVPNTPPDGTSAMRQTSHHAVSPLGVCRLSFHGAVTSSWGGKQPMGR